jgi:hypothetical protein
MLFSQLDFVDVLPRQDKNQFNKREYTRDTLRERPHGFD